MSSETLSPRMLALKSWVVATIPCEGNSLVLRQALREMRLHTLLIYYMAWVDRLIAPRKRRTKFAQNFWQGLSDHQLVNIRRIAQMSEKGDDLRPFLSRLVDTHGFTFSNVAPTPKKKWADGGRGNKDFALNTLDAHHLHLVARMADRRKGQSSDLLYVLVSRNEMNMVMLGDHKTFDDGRLKAAIARERFDDWKLSGITPPRGPDWTDEEERRLARNGFVRAEVVDDAVVLLNPTAMDGSSLFHVRHADKIMMFLHEWDAALDDPSERRRLEGRVALPLGSLDHFRWAFWYGDFCLLPSGGKGVCLFPWKR